MSEMQTTIIKHLKKEVRELEAEVAGASQVAKEDYNRWEDAVVKLEAEVEALRELLYAEGWGDTSIDKALEAGND